MTTAAFNQGFAALSKVFPGLNLDPKLYWTMLQDLDGQFFLMSVWEFIKNTKEIYPGTNIIAILRSRVEELRLEAQQKNTLKIEADTEADRIERWKNEAVPMPEDCREALDNLGIKQEAQCSSQE